MKTPSPNLRVEKKKEKKRAKKSAKKTAPEQSRDMRYPIGWVYPFELAWKRLPT